MPTPHEETPRPRDCESLRDSIRKLSEQSERLKEAARENSREAEQIAARLKAIEKMLAASQKAITTSGRIS